MSCVVRKTGFCICENKDADQIRGNREADQRLCFRYIDNTIHLLSKYEISGLKPSSVSVQPGLCRPGMKPRSTVFSQQGSNVTLYSTMLLLSGQLNCADSFIMLDIAGQVWGRVKVEMIIGYH